jgi:hypothetical protein
MNKFLTGVIALILIIIAVFSIEAKPNIESKYFRHLMFRESPFAPYKGIHPISASVAERTAHYKFDYDSEGRVTSISHKIGSQIINDNGNWDSFVWFAPKVTMEYSSNGEIHRYFNADDEQVTVHGHVHKAVYATDAKGNRQELNFYDKEGKASQNAWNVHRYQWTLDAQQRIIEKRYSLANEMVSIRPDFKFYETRLEYARTGELKFMYNYGLDGKPANNESGAGIDRIHYDEKGNFRRWQVYSKDLEPVEGNAPNVHIGEHLYDTYGNKIGLRGFNVAGDQVAFSWGSFEHKHSYDKYGNQTIANTYDASGKLINGTESVFSRDGVLREIFRFVDEKGNPVVSKQLGGAAGIKFEYAEGSKKIVKRTPLNTSMKEISES